MDTVEIEVAVIGGGVVGLAIGAAAAAQGCATVVLEAEARPAQHASSRNSQVIHAGLYYPTGSLKARASVAGRRRLYAYLADRGIAHRQCGKLVVACDAAQTDALRTLFDRAQANGVEDLAWLDGASARALEPALGAEVWAALHSPQTGVLDSQGLVSALITDLEAAGGHLARQATVIDGAPRAGGLEVRVGGVSDYRVRARHVINAAGARSDRVARSFGVDAPVHRFVQGRYAAVSGQSPFERLIYPIPEAGGLGVHVTFDLSGGLRLGPDVRWVDGFDYDPGGFDPAAFVEPVAAFWPGVRQRRVWFDSVGLRPKLDAANPDFRIDGPEVHGVIGLVCLYGIESPGLTSCLALADDVLDRL
ncbi:MAG: NAD(P)/FAD-dependent oxidoreductase [Maricaulaceae bacterium]